MLKVDMKTCDFDGLKVESGGKIEKEIEKNGT